MPTTTYVIKLGTPRAKSRIAKLKNYSFKLKNITRRKHQTILEHHKEMRKAIIKSAKKNAPRVTGYLANSIIPGDITTSAKGSKMDIQVLAPYAYFVEMGFAPHFVPWQSKRLKGRGFTAGPLVLTGSKKPKSYSVKTYMQRPEAGIDTKVITAIYVKKHRPFMRPAVFRIMSRRYGPGVRKQMRKLFSDLKPGDIKSRTPRGKSQSKGTFIGGHGFLKGG